MPTFKFTDPDGTVFRITAPEGTSQREAFEMLQRSKPLKRITQSPIGRFAEGVAAPFTEFAAGIDPSAVPARSPMVPGGEVPGWADVERARRPGGLAKTLGRITGDIGLAAGPAGAGYRGARALTQSVPWVRHWAPLAAESAAVGGIEAAKLPQEGESRVGAGLTGAGLNLATGAGMGAASRFVSPRLFPKSQAALREEAAQRAVGVEPNLPLSMAAEPTGPVGRMVQWLHRQPLRALPGVGTALRRQTENALDNWRESMLLRALPERARGRVAMPRQRTEAEFPVEQTFQDIDDWYKMEYGEILDPYRFQITRGPNADRLADAYEGIAETNARREVTEKFGDYVQALADDQGRLTGSAISSLKTKIRNAMRKTEDADVEAGWGDVLESVDDVVEGSLEQLNPTFAQRYRDLREPYRNLVTLEEAAARGPAKEAMFSPDELYAASIGKGKRERGARIVAQGRAPLKGEAQRVSGMMAQIPKRQTESNIFQLGALAGLTTAGGFTAPVTTSAFWTGAGLSIPRWGQRYMMSEYPYQQAIADFLRRRPVQEAARATRIGVATGEY